MTTEKNQPQRGNQLRRMTRVALMAAVLCVTSQWAIPLGPVPMTTQTFFVVLCGALLGAPDGALAVLVYLLVGACGLPVFSGFSGGVSRFVSATGGFLVAFPVVALLSALLSRRGYWAQLLMAFAGLAVMEVAGTVQLMLVTSMALPAAISAAVLPFIAKDIVSVALSVLLGRAIRRRI